ncbi:MAG: phenylacetate--CoA ligase [Actinobacteria bacterium]|nr:phenylacetate--CoA ligase [Actinomycetota bacterium]
MRIWDEKMETLSGAGLEEFQLGRLRATLERIWDAEVPYRSRMEEAGLAPSGIKGMEDLECLPFSVKQDFKDNYPLGMLAVPPEKVVRFHTSSGTTGSRTLVAYTAGDLENWTELVARFATAAGVAPSDVAQISFTYGLFTGGFGLHYGLERIGAAVVPASGGNTELQLSLISELESTVLVATPTYALYLLEEGTSRGFDFEGSTLRLGLFGAEPWSEGIRARLEEGMGISATDNYGLSEVVGPGVSGECELKDGMHIAEDHFIAEVVDPATGRTLPDGEHGELVLTTLTREAVPVVRFRTGDLTSIDHGPCDCGRKNARMSKVLGRTDDMLIIRGVNVYPSQVERALLEIEGIEPHYFIVVDRDRELDTLEVWVEVSDEVFSDDTRDMKRFAGQVEARLKAALNVRARVSLKEPRTLERAVGKAKRILDRRE